MRARFISEYQVGSQLLSWPWPQTGYSQGPQGTQWVQGRPRLSLIQTNLCSTLQPCTLVLNQTTQCHKPGKWSISELRPLELPTMEVGAALGPGDCQAVEGISDGVKVKFPNTGSTANFALPAGSM